jgi:hypothetical protein
MVADHRELSALSAEITQTTYSKQAKSFLVIHACKSSRKAPDKTSSRSVRTSFIHRQVDLSQPVTVLITSIKFISHRTSVESKKRVDAHLIVTSHSHTTNENFPTNSSSSASQDEKKSCDKLKAGTRVRETFGSGR